MYIDLDHFKHINDSLGHAAGDQLLQSVAKRLQKCVRLSDTVSRQGGDEFVVVMTGMKEIHAAVLVARKLLREISPRKKRQPCERRRPTRRRWWY